MMTMNDYCSLERYMIRALKRIDALMTLRRTYYRMADDFEMGVIGLSDCDGSAQNKDELAAQYRVHARSVERALWLWVEHLQRCCAGV